MTQEKVESLNKYLNNLNDRLNSPVPDKHKNNPDTFKAFLKNEIRLVTNTLEEHKLNNIKK